MHKFWTPEDKLLTFDMSTALFRDADTGLIYDHMYGWPYEWPGHPLGGYFELDSPELSPRPGIVMLLGQLSMDEAALCVGPFDWVSFRLNTLQLKPFYTGDPINDFLVWSGSKGCWQDKDGQLWDHIYFDYKDDHEY